ncbi:MAG: polysaccharide biosynthesis C-terminal domain-containing protein [Hyphomicrobiaceae bacterium]
MIATIVAINVMTVIMNLALNLLLTPKFGVLGAAVSLGLSVCFNASALLSRFRAVVPLKHQPTGWRCR